MQLSRDDSRRAATQALREIRRRKEILRKMEEDSFPKQWNFITDPSRLKAALTTRRAGKSMADAMYFLKEGMAHPGCSMLYGGLTDDSAWRILWKDCLKKLGKEYGINLKPLKSEFAVRMEDYGSIIYFLGIDNNAEEMAKALGQKYRLCIVDEAAMYRQDIKMLVYDILFPAVSDYEGTICLTGMPCNNTKTFFHEVTTGREGGWSVHKWTWADNRYVADKLHRQVEFLKKATPGLEDTPTFKQNYMGMWCVDGNARIYQFDEKKNLFDTLPDADAWHYVMGIDLGYSPDPTAFVILAYRDYDPCLYVVDVYMRKEMDITSVAERIKHYSRVYKLDKIVIDNSAKQAVEELKQRHALSLTPADKAGKADFIQLCNDDLTHGRVKVRSINCTSLIGEWQTLVWDEKALLKGIYAEPSRAKNHCSDAFLYAWRYCYNWVDRGVEIKPARTHEEQVEAFWEREISLGSSSSQLSTLEQEYGFRE